ncbi:MAG: hypothetical protein DRJ50_14980, partial [Actinobacteria bacterium]
DTRIGGDIGMDIRVVPKRMHDIMQAYRSPTNLGAVWYDQITAGFKIPTLAWRAAWLINNAIGGAIMTAFSAGVTLPQMYRHGKALNQLMRDGAKADGGGNWLVHAAKEGTMSKHLPSEIVGQGINFANAQQLSQLSDRPGVLAAGLRKVSGQETRVGRFTDRMYAINEFTDSYFRSITYLEQLDRHLKRVAPIPPSYLTESGDLRPDITPDEMAHVGELYESSQQMIDASIKATLNTLGDFTRLDRWERTVMKRAIPFWPWLRHQFSMSIRMPLNNPLRYAWLSSLSDIVGQEDDDPALAAIFGTSMPISQSIAAIAGYSEAENPGIGMGGMIPLLPLGQTPFGRGPGELEGGGGSLLDPSAIGRSANPILNVVGQLGFGYDVRAGSPMSRPYSDATRGPYGSRVDRPGLFRGDLAEVGYVVAGGIPLTKSIRDMVGSAVDSRPRFDSGEVIQRADPRQDNLLSQAVKLSGVSPISIYDYSQQVEEKRRRLLQEERGR